MAICGLPKLKIETLPNKGDITEIKNQIAIVLEIKESENCNYSGDKRVDILILCGLEKFWTQWWPQKEEESFCKQMEQRQKLRERIIKNLF